MKTTIFKSLFLALAALLAVSAPALADGTPVLDTSGMIHSMHATFDGGIMVNTQDLVNNRVTVYQGGAAQKVVFLGQPQCVETEYTYANGLLASSKDMYNNVTTYNPAGQALETKNAEGQTVAKWDIDPKTGAVTMMHEYGIIGADADGKGGTMTEIGRTIYEEGQPTVHQVLSDKTKPASSSNGWVTDYTNKYVHGTLVSTTYANGNTAHYANGKISYVTNSAGVKIEQYNYVDGRLATVDTFDPGSGKLKTVMEYDKYGRQDKLYQAFNGIVDKTKPDALLQEFIYATKDTEARPGDSSYNVRAGALIQTKTYIYTYDESGTLAYGQTSITFYKHGDPSKPGDSYIDSKPTIYNVQATNNIIKANAPAIAAGVDPTVNGLITFENGKAFLNVTSEAEYNKVISALDSAITSATNAASVHGNSESTLLATLKAIKKTLSDSWTKDKKIKIALGAINESEMTSKEGVWLGGNNYKAVDAKPYWNDAAMISIINKAGSTATISWTYWAIQSDGTVWAFANAQAK